MNQLYCITTREGCSCRCVMLWQSITLNKWKPINLQSWLLFDHLYTNHLSKFSQGPGHKVLQACWHHLAIADCKGKMCIPPLVVKWSIKVASSLSVKWVTKRVLYQKPPCDCFGHQASCRQHVSKGTTFTLEVNLFLACAILFAVFTTARREWRHIGICPANYGQLLPNKAIIRRFLMVLVFSFTKWLKQPLTNWLANKHFFLVIWLTRGSMVSRPVRLGL